MSRRTIARTRPEYSLLAILSLVLNKVGCITVGGEFRLHTIHDLELSVGKLYDCRKLLGGNHMFDVGAKPDGGCRRKRFAILLALDMS